MNYQHHYHKPKDLINKFNFYLEILGRHSFYPYGTKKNKKIQIDLDDTVYTIYLAEINFYAWMIDRNLHNYVLEEIFNSKEIKYIAKKQKKECEALTPVTKIKIQS